MPRKAFIADLAALRNGANVACISGLQAGGEDGSFDFTFTPPDSSFKDVAITAIISDLSDYPTEHRMMLYTTSDSLRSVDSALQDLSASLTGAPIERALFTVSNCLVGVLSGTQGNPTLMGETDDGDIPTGGNQDADSNGDNTPSDSDEEMLIEEDDSISEDSWCDQSIEENGLGLEELDGHVDSHARTEYTSKALHPGFRSRIRSDLRAAKDAGFKVGYLGHILKGRKAYVSISCRVSKLGISEEAMQAWQLQKQKYLIFLIEYAAGYMSLEELILDDYYRSSNVEMRVGVGSHYKPTWNEAFSAFSKAVVRDHSSAPSNSTGLEATPSAGELKASATAPDGSGGELGLSAAEGGFQGIFIGAPLRELLNSRLLRLLRYRLDMRFGWSGAEQFYNDHQGILNIDLRDADAKYYVPETSKSSLPPLVVGDQLTDLQTVSSGEETVTRASFPLIGMQFVLRHVVRCTEFCMVCHCKVTSDFESLKPYVCSQPLCLYQYMALGFGPSIEYEIMTHPRVVDLLVSFCFAGASGHRLKDFPIGMGLTVPMPGGSGPGFRLDVKYYPDSLKVIFELPLDGPMGCPVKVGDWVVLGDGTLSQLERHCRVANVSWFPVVKLGPPVSVPQEEYQEAPTQVTPFTTFFTKYDQNFDHLPDPLKRSAIVSILATLPSVSEMRSFLTSGNRVAGRDSSLHRWHDRLSPAALGMLRWIIASNRSCLVEVDNPNRSSVATAQDRVVGMPNWKQFRFAMGAPDKEQRFLNSLAGVAPILNLTHPTIFAWHGSGIGNWHGIVREGFNFNEVVNGRAYGNGVYHSLDSHTGAGYSKSMINPFGAPNGQLSTWYTGWPQSELKISIAMCLNEIVNVTERFVSRSPHLVVAQLDWIQTRYLFVKCPDQRNDITEEPNPSVEFLDQDPAYFARGDSGAFLKIPMNAVLTSNRFRSQGIADQDRERQSDAGASSVARIKRRRVDGIPDALTRDSDILFAAIDDSVSVDTDVEDVELFFSDNDESILSTPNNKGKSKLVNKIPNTDFSPGTLDHSSLPILNSPRYATTTATNAIQRELRAMLKLQESQPLHELGWYIDPDYIGNVYQWIVELHSFDPALPLSVDMKKMGVKSVVLEVRFGMEFPMSPPFVRVIRPRFLSFAQRGGGHVTAGGALCMELLTNSGWSAVSSMESVLLQVRMAMSSTDPYPAMLESRLTDYQAGEAVQAYVRSCRMHGWEIPKDLYVMAESG
ncbi:MAG: hypothetical protein M1840_008441 [Geoglossum simile]|nr:MAG: hypothetical protein M1840_008441 [Geoglossum simile]